MNDGGCLEVNNPTIDVITLTFRDHQGLGDYLLNLGMFVVTLVLDYVTLPKALKEEFFSLDKIEEQQQINSETKQPKAYVQDEHCEITMVTEERNEMYWWCCCKRSEQDW